MATLTESNANHSDGGLSRRDFLLAGVAATGGLIFALPVLGQEESPSFGAANTEKRPRNPSAFVKVDSDDTITVVTPAVEMGQGGHTAMPMILMEELGGDWGRLVVRDAPPDIIFNNPVFGMQMTVGSFSVRGWYIELRRIGAAAREMLVQAAADQWGVPPAECDVMTGRIHHMRSDRSCTFGSVAGRAATLPVPSNPKIKTESRFGLIGTSPLRVDIADKVNGSAQYGIDMALPGMLYGAVRCCPTLGGKLRAFDDEAARTMPGFHSTVRIADGIIVLASGWWEASQAIEKVKIDFDAGKLAGLASAEVSRRLAAGFEEPGLVARSEGDVDITLAAAAHTLQSTYEVPYLAHACMEPMNCTAQVDQAGCEIWCGTQAPQRAQAAAAEALGISPERVKVHVMYLGGGFGRRGESDFVAQAAIAARSAGRPVKLIWSREEDIRHDFYRPAAAIRFRAGLDAAKQLVALDAKVVTASSPPSPPGAPPTFTTGVADATYAIPNFRVVGLDKRVGVRFGYWRSVNDSHNPFMLEGFIDELARSVGQDPYRFRRSLLQHEGGRRQLAVLDLVAEKCGYDHPKPGHSIGICAFPAFGSYIAAAADVTMEGKRITLHRVVTGIDCGVVIHPDNVKAQLSGGMVYGLSAVLRGAITLRDGAVEQGNFTDYPILSMAEMPPSECYIMPSTAPPGGVGEPGTGPIAPALCNAIFAASGERIRRLPLSTAGYTVSVARS
jgi:isoquinoline 1-oxidoreductase beta subunit